MADREWVFDDVRIRFSGDFPSQGIARFFREAATEYRKYRQFARMTVTIDLGRECKLFITSENYSGLKGEKVADALLVAAAELDDDA